MEQINMEFKKNLEEALGDKMPKPEDRKLSAITGRIILSAKEYQELQVELIFKGKKNRNMWCAGVNKNADPNIYPIVAMDNFIEVGDAKSFSELFITEHEAEFEAKKFAAQKEKEKEEAMRNNLLFRI